MPEGVPKSVSQKMGIKEGSRAILVNAPDSAVEAMRLPGLDLISELEGLFDYIHVFTTSGMELDGTFPEVRQHLAPGGMLWVSWPKGNGPGTDLTLKEVIRIGYTHGLVESKCLSVDATWSALKFTHPVEGKIYENSYGRLPGASSDG